MLPTFEQIKQLTLERKSLIDNLKLIVDDDCQNFSFFRNEKEHCVDEFLNKQDEYNSLLLQLRATHLNPIISNATPLDLQEVLKQVDDSNPIFNQHN